HHHEHRTQRVSHRRRIIHEPYPPRLPLAPNLTTPSLLSVVPLMVQALPSKTTVKVSVMGEPPMVALSGSQSRVLSSFQWQTWSCTSPVEPTANQWTALRSGS